LLIARADEELPAFCYFHEDYGAIFKIGAFGFHGNEGHGGFQNLTACIVG
jgi:hypothetical protein